MNEAPYSFNCFFVDRRGFNCQVTLRGEDGSDLMQRVDGLLDWLLEHGGLPADRYGNPVGRPAAQPANGNGNGQAAAPAARGQEWCPVHNVEMKLFQKDGRQWYSHKTDDGKWCRGK
jgi:hypothetical protein